MSDLKDPLADAFFSLRLEAPHEIEVPGTAAARQSVRRRRIARAITVTAAVGTVVAVVTMVAGLNLGRPRDGTATQPRPAVTATLSVDAQEQLGVDALAKLGITPDHVRPGTMFGAVRAQSAGFSYAFGTAAEPFPAGTYLVNLACVGAGSVQVSLSDQQLDLAAECDGDTVDAGFTLNEPATIPFTYTGSSRANGHAGIALHITDPAELTSRSLLAASPAGTMGGSAFLSTTRMDVDETPHDKGTYELALACTGQGTVAVHLTLGATEKSTTMPCPATGHLGTLRINAAGNFTGITVRIEPDDDARWRAACAYTVRRL